MEEAILLLTWTPALVLFLVALVIAVHHCYIHSLAKYDKARDESCFACCYLQPSDLRNHEVWVVSLSAVALTWVVAGYTFESRLRCS